MKKEEWRDWLRGMPQDDLRDLALFVREEVLAREVRHASELRVGDTVEFEDRNGKTHRGHVASIASRTVTVHTPPQAGHGADEQHEGHWRVSATLIRRVMPPETQADEGRS